MAVLTAVLAKLPRSLNCSRIMTIIFEDYSTRSNHHVELLEPCRSGIILAYFTLFVLCLLFLYDRNR